MGAVYLAHDAVRGEDVALKILLSEVEGADRFVRESQTLASLGHPGIVRYVAHGTAPHGAAWLAMERLQGQSLSERLRRGPLPVLEAVSIARQAAEALGAAHAAGVVHRDIKPGNLFLVPDGEGVRVKVLDFGIARTQRPDLRSLTTTGTVLGTPYYMAPEQARGMRGLDARVDVWSLGAVLYEMLSGRRPFEHESVVAVLAAVLLEEPTPIEEVRPEVGSGLSAIVTASLDKRPDGRAPSGSELAASLAALDLRNTTAPSPPPQTGLTEREQRVVFVVLALHAASGSDATVSDAGWSSTGAAQRPEGELRAAAESVGARVEVLGDGALLVIVPEDGAPSDQAARAARLALAMHAAVPTASLVVGAGRAEVGLRLPVGDVVQRAAELAEHARADPESRVRLDEIAASFLGARFEFDEDALGLRLLRAAPEGDSGQLLRARAPMVGRERELRALTDLAEECVEEPVARVALLTGPAGSGKSRLLAELEEALRARHFEVFSLRGEPLKIASPHAVAALLVRTAAGIEDGEPLPVRQRKLRELVVRTVPASEAPRTTMFLGEIARTPTGDVEADAALRAARADAFLRGDLVERAFGTWLESACADHPIAVLLDDLPFVDEASLALFDRVLTGARDRALLIVLAARPEEGAPPVLEEHEPLPVRLARLSSKSSRLLMQTLAPGADAELIERIVQRAEGNPLFLEEMAKALGRGEKLETLPTSVLAVVEDRLSELPSGARRVLRALSILGTGAKQTALAALLGVLRAGELEDWLGLLERRELLVRERTVGDGPSWSFRQPLVRDAAYAMLTSSDRKLGHRLAAELSIGDPDADAAVIAVHFDRSEEGARAAAFYADAAGQALGAHDLKGALARADRGLALSVEPDLSARLTSQLALAHRWRGAYPEALDAGLRALGAHPEGSAAWLEVASTVLSAASQLRRIDEVRPLIETLMTLGAEPASRTALIVAVCRAGSALLALGDAQGSQRALDRADLLDAENPGEEPLAVAWRAVLSASLSLRAGDVGGFAVGTARAVEAYEAAGDARDAVNQRVRLGNAWTSLGRPDRAEPVLRAAVEDAARMGLRLIEGYAHQNLGHALAGLDRIEDGRRALDAAIQLAESLKHAALEAGARLYLAELLREQGDPTSHARAEREAGRARELATGIPGFGAVATAHHALALLKIGALDGARAASVLSSEALDAAPEAFEEGEVSIRLAYLEVLASDGGAGLNDAAGRAWARIEQRASKIGDPALRASFLDGVPDHRRIRALASG